MLLINQFIPSLANKTSCFLSGLPYLQSLILKIDQSAPLIILKCRSTEIINSQWVETIYCYGTKNKTKETKLQTLKITILLALFLIGLAGATSKPKSIINVNNNTVETLIIGLESDNDGLRSSSAYMIGELQLNKGIIPLMRVLHNEENEDLRIAAALALYKIGSPVAIYAVKQASKFDESERVSKHCASFYNEYKKNKLIGEELNVDVSKTALK